MHFLMYVFQAKELGLNPGLSASMDFPFRYQFNLLRATMQDDKERIYKATIYKELQNFSLAGLFAKRYF